jgi:hypothetical protein
VNAETTWSIDSAIEALSVVEQGTVTGYDLSIAPPATQYLGQQLAAAASAFGPTVIASWTAAADSVLAHIVATELGLGRIVVSLDLGVLDVSRRSSSPLRAVLVAAMLDDHSVAPVAKLLTAGGHSLAGAVALGSHGRPAALTRGPVETVVLA